MFEEIVGEQMLLVVVIVTILLYVLYKAMAKPGTHGTAKRGEDMP